MNNSEKKNKNGEQKLPQENVSYYAGMDISDKRTNICIVDSMGNIIREMKAETHPEHIRIALQICDIPIEKVGMENGAKSNWIFRGLSEHFNVVCYNSNKIHALISARGNKTDENDAQVIAEATRLDAFAKIFKMDVHVKSQQSQETLSFIRARESAMTKLTATRNEICAIYKTHGYIMPDPHAKNFSKAVLDTSKRLPKLISIILEGLISTYDTLCRNIEKMDKTIEEIAKQNANARLLMTIPSVGPITALYFVACIDDPSRFADAQSAGSVNCIDFLLQVIKDPS